MKEIKKFLLVEVLLVLLKGLGGLLSHSITFYVSCLFELFLCLSFFLSYLNKENKKYKSILSSFLAFLFFMGSVGLIFLSFITEVKKMSWFFLFFFLICFFLRYIVLFYSINKTYCRKKGSLFFAEISSTMDFLQYGILFVSFLFSKFSYFVPLFCYADRVGVFLFSLLLWYKVGKVIKQSFQNLYQESNSLTEEVLDEVRRYKELKQLHSCNLKSIGGIKYVKMQIQVKENLNLLDLNTFMITLQDYMLKYCDVLSISLIEKGTYKKPRVRSKKQDARNSRGRNRQTQIKRKNTTKKNKKR